MLTLSCWLLVLHSDPKNTPTKSAAVNLTTSSGQLEWSVLRQTPNDES
jgi:hypothetical protein